MTKRKPKPEDPQVLFREIAKRIPDMSQDELVGLFTDLKPLRAEDHSDAEAAARKDAEQSVVKAPKTPDELHALIIKLTGYNIPRVAVCSDHQAPFSAISDAYFNNETAILILGSRESGKTLAVAILHYINAETKPGIEGITFGAIKPQAEQAYKYVKSFVYERDDNGNRVPKPQIDGEPTRTKTEWRSGSQISVVIGTRSGVNSPHPQVVHADEIDLMDPEIFAESRSMSSSKTLPGGKRIPAMDIATSTRKTARGPMQVLLDEVDEAKKHGHKPPWSVFAYCFRESAAEVPECRCADPVERVRRLLQLGEPANKICSCDKIVKSEWEEGHPRTLESVCRGDLFRSRGWMHKDDIDRKFLTHSQPYWEAQMECRRPMSEGLFLPTFTRSRHCVRGWVPRPEYGRLTQGVDWGGADTSVVLWTQGPLRHPVEIIGFNMKPIVVPQGAYVVFDSIYWFDRIGATSMADAVVTREIAQRVAHPGWRVQGRFADPAGAQQRNDWHEHSPPLRTQWKTSRDFDPSVETVQGLMADNLLYVDVEHCAALADDFEGWRMKGGKEYHDSSSHGPAALRYNLGNVVILERRREREHGKAVAVPAIRERGLERTDRAGLVGAVGSSRGSQGVESEQWRQSMGISSGSGNQGSDGWRLG
jgi:hypothetical protein